MPWNRDVPLVQRQALTDAHLLLTFRHPEIAQHARAGQFVMIKAGLSAEPPLRRPFSIQAIDPGAQTFTLFVKTVGPGSRALAALDLGALAQCLGPLGRPFDPPPREHTALLVAGGYGIAPFALFSEELRRAGRTPIVFYGGRGVGELQLRAPFERLGVPLVTTTDDGSLGRRGRVTEAVLEWLETHPGPATLYACGPEAMLHACARLGQERALPTQVSLDPWMGCGIGTCLGCVVWTQRPGEPRPKYRCACTEGPVFDADVVLWPGQSCSRAAAHALAVEPS
jgi:dihydroorotate dehydrogenase electron transfer subunit